MDISIVQGSDQKIAADVAVVIDTLRAFTTANVFFSKGVSRILLADSAAAARNMKSEDSARLLAGEINALKIPGFEYGNSPHEVAVGPELNEATVVMTTTNGVKAVLNCTGSKRILVTGFSLAEQCIRILRRSASTAKMISLVASHPTGDEDLVVAEYIRDQLLGLNQIRPLDVAWRILRSKNAEKFLDPSRLDFDVRDLAYSLEASTNEWVIDSVFAGSYLALERNPL